MLKRGFALLSVNHFSLISHENEIIWSQLRPNYFMFMEYLKMRLNYFMFMGYLKTGGGGGGGVRAKPLKPSGFVTASYFFFYCTFLKANIYTAFALNTTL